MKKNKICIEFNEQHLFILISALETYSRLQSGQISMALDIVYSDKNLSWNEKTSLERYIRFIVFPQEPKRQYDEHGGFYDQYNNEYDKNGYIIKESEEWKELKGRPHFNDPRSSFGIGCKEVKNGTIAFEIKKVIDQYLHYKRNNGYRNIMDVSGDGMKHSYSGVPVPKVKNFKPELKFEISSKHQKKIENFFAKSQWNKLWDYIKIIVFKDNPLPQGSFFQIQKTNSKWFVVVSEPIMSERF